MQNENWSVQPEATQLIQNHLNSFVGKSPWLKEFSNRLASETGTRLFDWIDRLTVSSTPDELAEHGFHPFELQNEPTVYRHPKALLPSLISSPSSRSELLAIKVDSVIDFAVAMGLDERQELLGAPSAQVRRLLVRRESDLEIWVVERHGSWGWNSPDVLSAPAADIARLSEAFHLRPRRFDRMEHGFQELNRIIAEAVGAVGTGRAADMFFAAERKYWQSRNRAAQLQKLRQARLGLGWANHDHHTYRSSRQAFHLLTRSLEKLGMNCRERFYAGSEAGWGAQVLEQAETGIVVFADVDLAPDEVVKDFAHHVLPPQSTLGTVGLWCALHGEAILEAGLHHLECQFDFDAARSQLETLGTGSMKPFTDFPFLRQCFTVGETWPVRNERIDRALEAGHITKEQAEQFRKHGAIGSHLEILERNDGYKGFNQTGISQIIKGTDPRFVHANA